MKTLLQFINDNNVEALEAEFAIKANKYESGLVCLNYNQIESPRFHPFADLCRGLIVDIRDPKDVKIAARGFKRFYNVGEGNTTIEDDIQKYEVFEKYDGSLINIYFDGDNWQIATRGTAYAESSMMNGLYTFRQYVLKTLGFSELEFQGVAKCYLDPNLSYVCEIIGPENRVVTPYKEAKLVLLDVIEKESGASYFHSVDAEMFLHAMQYQDGVELAKKHSFSTKEDLLKAVQTLTGLAEGFVLRHKETGERMKLKSDLYVAVHKMRGDTGVLSFKAALELFITNEHHEYLAHFPEDKEMFDKIEKIHRDIVEDAKAAYFLANQAAENTVENPRKAFALVATKYDFSGLLFSVLTNGGDPDKIDSFLREMSIKVLLGLFEKRLK